MTPEALVEIAAAGLALWAAARSLPRAPALDWERLFKVALATVLRGEAEAAGGDAARWEAAVAALVPYHPAGRLPEEKLSRPDPAALPPPALAGERALAEALAALPDPAARFRRMYAQDKDAQDALLTDPAALGEAYALERALGQGATWEALAGWSPPVLAGLKRRFSHLAVAGVGGLLGEALAAAAGLRGQTVAALPDDAALAHALDALLASPSDRLLIVAEGDALPPVLAALHAHPGLRDRVAGLVSVGGQIGATDAQRAWLAGRFTHEGMDTELNRATPYFSITIVDPADPKPEAWAGQRFPSPPLPPSGRQSIDAIDLGPLPAAWLSPERRPQLARALWAVLAARLG